MEEKIWHKRKWPLGVPQDIDFPDIPVHQFLVDAARDYPDSIYTIFQDSTRTFKQVDEAANQVAHFLLSRGIQKGDRVAIFLPNLPHYPIIYFGVLKSGATCVTCNPMYTDRELHFQLKDSGAKMVFVMDHKQFYPTACRAIHGTDVRDLVYCNVWPFLPLAKGVLGQVLGKVPQAERLGTPKLAVQEFRAFVNDWTDRIRSELSLSSLLSEWKSVTDELKTRIQNLPDGTLVDEVKGIAGGLRDRLFDNGRHEPGHLSFEAALLGQPKSSPEIPIDPREDLALILYTGGTTGVPKGASLTHRNFVSNVIVMEEWIRLGENPAKGIPGKKLPRGAGNHCAIGVLPWYHSYGQTLTMLLSARLCGRLICVPDPRAGDPPFTEVLQLIEKHRVTLMHAVPIIYSAVINHPLVDKFDLSSLLACGAGAAPLPVEVARQYEEKTGAVIFEGYGLSETSPMTHANPTNVHNRKFGSVGLPVPGTDVKILDAETGEIELPLGEDGEISVSGPQVMKGYWNRPDEDALVFRILDGKRFFLTGDIGHLDEDGFLFITDRKKDMIDVGGLKAYPREIEETLYLHPKIELACVVGIPDERAGQAVKAFVKIKNGETVTEEEIIAFCRDKMAGYKRPRSVEFRDELPMSTVGKILRRQLRDEEWAKSEAKKEGKRDSKGPDAPKDAAKPSRKKPGAEQVKTH